MEERGRSKGSVEEAKEAEEAAPWTLGICRDVCVKGAIWD